MKISQKLTLGFMGIALLVAVVGYISVNASQKALQRSIGQTSTAFAATILDQIDRSIYNRVEAFQEYCKNSLTQRLVLESNGKFENLDNIESYINQQDTEWVSTSKETVTHFMKELIENDLSEELRRLMYFYEEKYGYKVIGEIFVTNKYGANVAQSGKTSDYYQADEQWWTQAKDNGIDIGNIEYDESSSVYSTNICTRIDDQAGNFAGVIKVVLNVDDSINLIKQAETVGIDFKLLAEDDRIIYATGEFEFLQLLPEKLLHLLHSSKCDSNSKKYFISSGDISEEGDEFFAYARSKGYKDYKGLGWILMTGQKTETIFASVAELKKRILTASVIITALAIILGLVISGSISRPIGKLSAAAVKIGKGELDNRLEIKSNDEVGQLAVSFNKMAESLKNTTTSVDNLNREIAERKQVEKELSKHRDHLEELVSERTTSLKKSNEKLTHENTKRKQAENRLISVNKELDLTIKRLSRSNKELQDFVYVASHDLREPLRTISSFGQLLEDSLKGQLEEDDSENLQFMIDGANRMAQMIEAMLMYSRVSTKGIQFDNVDLNELVEKLKGLELAAKLEETGGTIFVPDSLPLIRGDLVQIRQLLQNLIGNALKYHKPKTPPKVWIRVDEVLNYMVRIEIEDNGIGIKEKYYKDIFTMFKRLHSGDSYQG
ncbi:MAG: HAMP domain-containing protein, partial [Planctomycetota bacterium]